MTKIQFLLKQTQEQRTQLDTMAEECNMSRTAYVQTMLDKAWGLRELTKAYATAEAQVTKAPPMIVLTTTDIAFINEAVDESDTVAPTPCACDGNCAGCQIGS